METEETTDVIRESPEEESLELIREYNRYGFYNGAQFEEDVDRISIETYRNREKKWAEMLKNWSSWSNKKEKLKDRCRKGIPDSFRGEVWQRLCNSQLTSANNLSIVNKKSTIYRPSLFNTMVGSSLSLRSDYRFRQNQNTLSKRSVLGQSENDGISHYSTEGRTKNKTLSISSDGIPPMGKETVQSKGSISFLMRKLSIRKEKTEPKKTDSSTSSSSGYQSKNNQHPGIPLTIQEALSPPSENAFSSDSNQICSTYSTPNDLNYSSLGSSKNYEQFVNAQDSKSRLSPSLSSAEDRDRSSSSYLWTGAEDSDKQTSSSKMIPNNRLQSSISLASMESDISINNYYFPNRTRSSDVLKKSQTKGSTLVASGLDNKDDPVLLYNYYKDQTPEEHNLTQIEKDIERQFPFHLLFASKEKFGQTILRDILTAYTIRNPEEGYCQGQAPIAAVLIMYMPEVNAFWTFVQICERYLQKYFVDDLDILLIDGEVLYGLLSAIDKPVYKYLTNMKIMPNLIMIDWFMCVYSRTLPWECFLRVLDMFLCEGKIILYKVGIVLLRRCFGNKEVRNAHRENCDALIRVREYPLTIKDTHKFIREVINCPISFQMVARETRSKSQQYYAIKKGQTANR